MTVRSRVATALCLSLVALSVLSLTSFGGSGDWGPPKAVAQNGPTPVSGTGKFNTTESYSSLGLSSFTGSFSGSYSFSGSWGVPQGGGVNYNEFKANGSGTITANGKGWILDYGGTQGVCYYTVGGAATFNVTIEYDRSPGYMYQITMGTVPSSSGYSYYPAQPTTNSPCNYSSNANTWVEGPEDGPVNNPTFNFTGFNNNGVGTYSFPDPLSGTGAYANYTYGGQITINGWVPGYVTSTTSSSSTSSTSGLGFISLGLGASPSPAGIIFDPSNGNLYIAETGTDSITVIDTATNALTASISLSGPPTALLYDPSNQGVYGTIFSTGTVFQVDTSTNTVGDSILVNSLAGIFYDPSTNAILAGTGGAPPTAGSPGYAPTPATLQVLDPTTLQTTKTVQLGDGVLGGAAFDPKNGYMYVAIDNYGPGGEFLPGSVLAVDVGAGSVVATVAAGLCPEQVVYVSTGDQVLVANTGCLTGASLSGPSQGLPNSVLAISGSSNKGTSITVGTQPVRILHDPDNGLVYVSSFGPSSGGVVSVVNPKSYKVVSTIPAGWLSAYEAYAASDSGLYVTFQQTTIASAALQPSGVLAIDTTSNQGVQSFTVGVNAIGEVYASSSNDVYVVCTGETSSNFDTGAVYVIPASSSLPPPPPPNQPLAQVNVGSQPVAMVDGGNGFSYVANFGSNTVSVVNDATNVVVQTIPVGVGPIALAVGGPDNDIYVANSGSNTVSIISSTNNGVIGTASVGPYPHKLFYVPDNLGNGGRMFVDDTGEVSVIDTLTHGVNATITTIGHGPHLFAFEKNIGDIVLITNQGSNTVSVVNTANVVTQTLAVGSVPDSILVYHNSIPGGAKVDEIFVSNGGSNTVSVIFPITMSVGETLPTGPQPGKIVAYSSDSVVVFNQGDTSVTVIDALSQPPQVTGNEPFASLSMGAASAGSGYALAIDGPGGPGRQRLGPVMSGANGTATTTQSVPANRYDVLYDPYNNDTYVSDNATGSVSVLNLTSDSVVTTVSVGTDPTALYLSAYNGQLYVVNQGSDSVTVLSGGPLPVALSLTTGGTTTSTTTQSSSGSSTSSAGGGGVPEFPYSSVAGTALGALVVVSYLAARRRQEVRQRK